MCFLTPVYPCYDCFVVLARLWRAVPDRGPDPPALRLPHQFGRFPADTGPWQARWGWGSYALGGLTVMPINKRLIESKEARLVIYNHQSLLDFLMVAYLSPPMMVPIGKREIDKVPVIGAAWRAWSLGASGAGPYADTARALHHRDRN